MQQLIKLTSKDERDLEFAHLNLDLSQVDFDKLRNPFAGYYSVEYHREILRAIRDPKNFYFTCKYILGLEIPPSQLVVLEELWVRPFPMLIAARGWGKTFLLAVYCLLRLLITQGCRIVVTSASFRQAKFIFDYMETILTNAPVYKDLTGTQGIRKATDNYKLRVGDSLAVAIPIGDGKKIRGYRANYIVVDEFSCLDANTLVETGCGLKRISDCREEGIELVNKDGDYEKSQNFIITPMTDVYEVTTERGYSFKCSSIHQVLTTNGFKIAKDLTSQDCLIFENKYNFPDTIVSKNGLSVDDNMAWLMGILIAEGSINNKHTISVSMTDKNCIDRIEQSLLQIDNNFHFTKGGRKEYKDPRFKGFCKQSYYINLCKMDFRNKLVDLGLARNTSHFKIIPWSILQSPRHVVVRFLSGLFEGDGSAFLWNKAFITKLGVSYYTVCKQLAQEVQILLRKLGYLSNLQSRVCRLGDKEGVQWMVRLNGSYAYSFAKELHIPKWEKILEACGETEIEYKPRINYCKRRKTYVVFNRINGKVRKNGSFKSYEEALKQYEKFDIEHLKVRSVVKLPDQQILYDFYLPKTHTFHGNGFVQHNSAAQQIFEEVISGFAASASSPIENMKRMAQIRVLKEKGKWNKDIAEQMEGAYKPNQVVISGTASWSFNHFAKYWRDYRAIIKSRGNKEKLHAVMGDKWSNDLDWKDYSVIRIPLELIPAGMMDEKNIARATAGSTTGIADNEYRCIFSKDSSGFFPRTLIESCVCKKPILIGNDSIQFPVRMYGDTSKKYVMAVDPASESDNFAVVILELNDNHIRVVFCWTTTRKKAFKRFTSKETDDNSFYTYAARKMRELLKVFPCDYISLDGGGGGVEVMSALHDLRRIESGEIPIWPIRKDDKLIWSGAKDWGYDDEAGWHMIEMVSMSKSDYVIEGNHALKRSLENKTLLFPQADAVSLMCADIEDSLQERTYDTLEDAVLEIEELKEELATIMHETTLTGKDKWVTPEIILSGNKRGRLRKDRYSALMMGHFTAVRLMKLTTIHHQHVPAGGFISAYRDKNSDNSPFYSGPSWYTDAANKSVLGIGVVKDQSRDPFKHF